MSPVEDEPASKKQKVDLDIHSRLSQERLEEGESVEAFKFSKKRVQMLSDEGEVPDECNGILYWMSREHRVQDNWSFLFAQRLALKNKISLHVAYCLVPTYLNTSIRQYDFLLKGLAEVEQECKSLNIEFHLLKGEANIVLPEFIKTHDIGGIVTDFCPLRISMEMIDAVKEAIPQNIPMCKVDAHNVVPCWLASDKQQYSAKTIRKRLTDNLPKFLTKFPPLIKHPYESKSKAEPVDWSEADKYLEVDRSVEPVTWAKPGTKAGLDTLNEFCLKRLRKYGIKSSDPNENATSHLSPWIHFGQISAQRCILEVKRYRKQIKEQVEDFLEQILIKRELADNFCFYQRDYDKVKGAYSWGQKTLDDHREDKRDYLYSKETLAKAETHDELFNAAQLQLLKEGKIHDHPRMYWAKKFLEWMPSPEEALAALININERYCLDGADPKGYVVSIWAICGIHDQGWTERPVFGKIRFISYDNCKRKFKIEPYATRYGAIKHKYVPPS